jgi:hypothetical protein
VLPDDTAPSAIGRPPLGSPSWDHRLAQSQGYGLRGRRVSGNFLWNDGNKVRALIALVGLRFPVCSAPAEGPDYDQNSSQA